jgi:hypothetical protein
LRSQISFEHRVGAPKHRSGGSGGGGPPSEEGSATAAAIPANTLALHEGSTATTTAAAASQNVWPDDINTIICVVQTFDAIFSFFNLVKQTTLSYLCSGKVAYR